MLIHGMTDNDIHPPLFGAAQRAFGLYRGLARRHQVRVLCVVPNRNRAPREENAAGVQLLRRKAWYTGVTWRLERARVAPLFLAAYGHRARARRLLAALPGAADVRIADLHLAGLLEVARAPLTVLHAHNVEADHFREAGPELLARGFWAERLRALEARAARRADLVVAASEEDAGRFVALHGIGAERVVVMSNGYDETAITAPSAAERARARAALAVGDDEYLGVFVGSDVPHNRAALAALCDRVMPALAREGFRLLVVGGVTRALGSRRPPWLIARPATPELPPLLHAADAGLNPALAGGGSNVKLPTYLAAGLAVVTTPHGLRGYAPLAPWVVSAGIEHTAEALRERPRGWAARGAALPPAIAAYGWGRLGEALGERLAARLSPAAAPGTPPEARRARA
jgi:glycosyltransferase involved in cell wall biosynthesis